MFDIEKELDELKIKDVEPDGRIVYETKIRVGKILRAKAPKPLKTVKPGTALPKNFFGQLALRLPIAAAIILAVLLIPFAAPQGNSATGDAVFYTIDINPSVELRVDNADTVISVACKNADALKLMSQINCLGLNVKEAIPKIVQQAKRLGYIREGEDNYVLVARFGADAGAITGGEVAALIADAAGGEAKALYLIGSLKDKNEADGKGKPAGLLLLEKEAREKGIDPQKYANEKGEAGKIIKDLETAEYSVPEVWSSVSDGKPVLKWSKIEHPGFLGYKISASKDDATPSYPENGYIAYITDAGKTAYIIKPGEGLEAGQSYYFGVTALYEGDVTRTGNAVQLKVPMEEEKEPEEPKPSEEPDEEPSEEPEDPYPASAISGKISDGKVRLSWTKAGEEGFTGYKIVASLENEHPKYPEDGYIKYITNRDTVSLSVYNGFAGLKAGKSYYFSVTVLYEGDRRVPGNAVRLKIPEPEPEPTKPDEEELKATTVYGAVNDGKVVLEWNKIENERFAGYKVVYSAIDSSPSYPDNEVLSFFPEAGTTRATYPLSMFEPGKKYYFSVTVRYDDGSIKKTGNAVALTMPEGDGGEDSEMTATTVYGGLNDTQVVLEWNKIEHPGFKYYKVVYSATNSSPKYGTDTCLSAFSEAGTTRVTYDFSKFEAGKKYYFSVTAVYADGTKKYGNAVALTIPEGGGEEVPEMKASSISGYIGDDGKVHLSWSKIEHPDFLYYKVVYSATNPSPKYPDDGYIGYFENAATTAAAFSLDKFERGKTGYFSITVVYDGGIKKYGNAISLPIPAAE